MKRVVKIGGVEIANLKPFNKECYFLSGTCIYLITKDNKIDYLEVTAEPLPVTMNDLITKAGRDPEKYIGWIYADYLRELEVEVNLILEDRAYYWITIPDKIIVGAKLARIAAQYIEESKGFRYSSFRRIDTINNLEHYSVYFGLDEVIVHYKVIPEV